MPARGRSRDAEERAAFEAVIDRIMQAWAADPGMHVYHFGHYEPTAFKRLMGRYATRAEALDRLLRGERFVDLHAVVRQALRAGVESYSIKQLEQFYAFVARGAAARRARRTCRPSSWRSKGHAPAAIPEDVRAAVQGYNRDDCRSTEALRDWLEDLRAELVAGGRTCRGPSPEEAPAEEQVGELETRQQAARARLLEGMPAEASAPDHPQHHVLAAGVSAGLAPARGQVGVVGALSPRAICRTRTCSTNRAAIAGLEFVERVEETRVQERQSPQAR